MSGTDPAPEAVAPAWIGEVIHFWFDELAPTDWFSKSATLDAQIRTRFLTLHEQLAAGDGLEAGTPRAILAAVIVLDQFSRNLFRGDARAYSADATARRLSGRAIEHGFDTALRDVERLFLYLPFEHSEDRADQALALRLITALGNEQWTRSALAHQALIDRFGRFPHRNAVLERRSSADELAALKEPMTSF